jgi:tetratricopeptide (TPR) repeat protein
MANASGLATDRLHVASFLHSPSSTEFTVSELDHRAVLTYHLRNNLDAKHELPLKYFLGSGHLGTTYLYFLGNYLFESPIAWYGPSQAYDMKPGLEKLKEVPPPLPMQSSCLRCHMSAVQPSEPGTINRYQGLPFLHGGITCEECHGDPALHERTGGKGKILNPARISADLRDSVCISCHLEGDALVERSERPALDYKPGEPISSFVAFYVKTSANLVDRGVSEVEQLSQSTCKRISGDRMSCTSCHDPHYTPPPTEKASFFRAKCLSCHSRPDFAVQHHPENSDCTGCHMPRTGAENIPHVAWTDHRILVRPPVPTPPSSEKMGSEELSAIFSKGATARDLAMANYQALLQGDRTREPIAWEQLNALGNQIANDKAALDALGNLSAERGDRTKAEQAFRRVLELDPDNLTALSNLGVLMAKEGKLNESLVMLEKAFARNQDIPGLSMNLARVQCISGDGASARNTLNTALEYSEGLDDLRRLMGQMNNCGSQGSK